MGKYVNGYHCVLTIDGKSYPVEYLDFRPVKQGEPGWSAEDFLQPMTYVVTLSNEDLKEIRKPMAAEDYFDDYFDPYVDEPEDVEVAVQPTSRWWVNKSGKKLRISDMTTMHLSNAIALLERQGQDNTRAYRWLVEELENREFDAPKDEEEKSMIGNAMKDRLLDRFFRKVDGVVWDLMSGNLGVRTKDGIITFVPAEFEGDGEDRKETEPANVTINPLDEFGVEIPAFAQDTPVDSLKPGDLIIGSREILGWIVATKGKSFEILKPSGTRSTWSPPKVKMLGFDSGGAMVVRSLMSTVGGDEPLKGFQSNMLPLVLMSSGGGEGALDDILPIMLMSQMNGVGGGGNMMQTILMMKMMQGESLTGLFGGAKKAGKKPAGYFSE